MFWCFVMKKKIYHRTFFVIQTKHWLNKGDFNLKNLPTTKVDWSSVGPLSLLHSLLPLIHYIPKRSIIKFTQIIYQSWAIRNVSLHASTKFASCRFILCDTIILVHSITKSLEENKCVFCHLKHRKLQLVIHLCVFLFTILRNHSTSISFIFWLAFDHFLLFKW